MQRDISELLPVGSALTVEMSTNGHKAPNRKQKKGLYTSPETQAQVIRLRMKGGRSATKQAIAKTVGLNRHTVTRILSQEEAQDIIGRTRTVLLNEAEKLAKRYAKIGLKGKAQNALQVIGKTMDGLQIFQPRSHQDRTATEKSEFDGRTREELDWYVKFGTREQEWPNEEEKEYFAKHGRWPQNAE